jgi:hypothetical protein
MFYTGVDYDKRFSYTGSTVMRKLRNGSTSASNERLKQ